MSDQLSLYRENVGFDKQTLRWNFALFIFFLAQIIIVYVLVWYFNLWDKFEFNFAYEISYGMLVFIVFVKTIGYFANRYFGEDRPLIPVPIMDDFKVIWLNPNYLMFFIVPVIMLPNFIGMFSTIKANIAVMNPFYLDEFLRDADRFIHFGVDPWKITHAVFGNFLMTYIIDVFYLLWFPVLFVYTIWQIIHVSFEKNRMQYLLSFVAVWTLNGMVLATLFSSVGPVYFSEFVGGSQDYQPLMDQLYVLDAELRASSIGKLDNLQGQELLLSLYKESVDQLGVGISAMPSLHVSTTLLLFLAARKENKYMGYLKGVMLFFIIVGSVHLGWHYAVDGYMALILTYLIWRGCGWLLNKLTVA